MHLRANQGQPEKRWERGGARKKRDRKRRRKTVERAKTIYLNGNPPKEKCE